MFLEVLLFISLLLVLLVLLYLYKGSEFARKSGIPWAPLFPLFVGSETLPRIQKFSQRYGPVFFQYAGVPGVFLGDEASVGFLLKNDHIFVKTCPPGKGKFYEIVKGLIPAQSGENWKKLHDITQPFFEPASLRNMLPAILTKTQEINTRLEPFARKKEVVDILEWTTRFAMDALGATAFGLDLGSLSGKASEFAVASEIMLETVSNPIRIFFPFLESIPFIKSNERIRWGYDHFHQFINDILEKKRKNKILKKKGENPDVLDYLFDAYDVGEITMHDLTCSVISYFIAGRDPISSCIAWVFYHLGNLPEIQEKVYQEIRTVIGDEEITFEKISRLEYLNKVLKESLRLSPPVAYVPWSRVSLEDVMIPNTGYFIPKGTFVSYSPWLQQHDPSIWDNPDQFDPSHFDQEVSKERGKYSHLPFGGGRRVCQGQYFSMLIMRVFCAVFLSKYQVIPVPQTIKIGEGLIHTPLKILISFVERHP